MNIVELLASKVILLPLILPSIIWKSPILPSLALIEPLNVALPSLSKWKPLELISIFPFEPLTNWVELPKKKAEELACKKACEKLAI
mgnify:CR=1 FL=1